jgi:hypothetical protein
MSHRVKYLIDNLELLLSTEGTLIWKLTCLLIVGFNDHQPINVQSKYLQKILAIDMSFDIESIKYQTIMGSKHISLPPQYIPSPKPSNAHRVRREWSLFTLGGGGSKPMKGRAK